MCLSWSGSISLQLTSGTGRGQAQLRMAKLKQVERQYSFCRPGLTGRKRVWQRPDVTFSFSRSSRSLSASASVPVQAVTLCTAMPGTAREICCLFSGKGPGYGAAALSTSPVGDGITARRSFVSRLVEMGTKLTCKASRADRSRDAAVSIVLLGFSSARAARPPQVAGK
jgi:hypothetical protein